MSTPVIAIPLGDIAGVGPEIVVRALACEDVYAWCRPLVIGEKSAVKRALGVTGLSADIRCVSGAGDAAFRPGTLDLVDLRNIDADAVEYGRIQEGAGRAAYEFIEAAVTLIRNGQADAMATTPINKESLKAAGIPFIGHTEILASLAGAEDPMTMFQVRNLRVFFLTRHLSLKDAVAQITRERVYRYVFRCRDALRQLGVPNPRIAVAGLNPHSGEHGLFGREEVEEIEPAILSARQDGVDVTGPVGADSVFHLALGGAFDAVISLYHDQGHIATKMVDFERTISLTVGLPFLRTSVDHGTAFDIAGKNIVSPVSMIEAIRLAAQYAALY